MDSGERTCVYIYIYTRDVKGVDKFQKRSKRNFFSRSLFNAIHSSAPSSQRYFEEILPVFSFLSFFLFFNLEPG